MPQSNFNNTVQTIEKTLSSYYGFKMKTSALHHILSEVDLQEWQDKPIAITNNQANVLLIEEPQELFIGIHFNKSIKDAISKQSPENLLNQKNLGYFITLVEEISHFHLIVNRASQNRHTTHLELEWQGEIDKLLISALYLYKQFQNPHIYQLFKIIYEDSIITSKNQKLYYLATRYAAKFWKQVIINNQTSMGNLLYSPLFLNKMQYNYNSSWKEKRHYDKNQMLIAV